MTKTIFILLSIHLFSAFNFGHIFATPLNNSDQELGDPCELKENQIGVCRRTEDCDYVKNLISTNKISQIVFCQFIKNIAIVCCPKTKIPTRGSNEKFSKALCKNKIPPIDLQNNIVRGTKAEVGEFPHQVAIGYPNAFDNTIAYDCGGSLIAEDIVITAAHCVNDKSRQPTTVRLGRTSLNLDDTDDDSPPQDIEIKTIVLHSEYYRKIRHNDIALIKLKKPANLSEVVRTICLSTRQNNIPKNLTITGYGRNNSNTNEKSDWLLKGTVYEYPLDKCKKKHKEYKNDIVESQICALNEAGVDSCQGDSGGPMIYDDGLPYLYGIISYGSACGSPLPAIYTRVDKFLSWIEEKMSLLG